MSGKVAIDACDQCCETGREARRGEDEWQAVDQATQEVVTEAGARQEGSGGAEDCSGADCKIVRRMLLNPGTRHLLV